MKYRVALILATASVAAFAAPAVAQDNFTGLRAEGLLGYDASRPGSTEDIDNSEDVNQTIDDIAYGGAIGFDVARNGLVFGVEGEYLESDAKTDFSTVGFSDFGVGNIEAGRDLYAGVRVGFLATPTTLVYAKGGYTNARYNLLATNNVTDRGSNVDFDGYRVGAGFEQSLNSAIYFKTEYRYSMYSKGEFEAPSGLESDRFDVDIDRHQIMAGLGVRF